MEGFSHILFKKNWKLSATSYFLLGQIQAFIRAISITPLLPHYHQQLLNVSLRKGAQATTAIEGNTLSDEEIKKIQDGGSLPPSKEYMEIEVKNILNAFNTILKDIIIKEKSDLVSPELIKYFHQLVGENLGEHFRAIPGKFRKHNVYVGAYRAPDYKDVSILVDKLCDFLKREFHFEKGMNFSQAVIQAIITHVYIEWIHPFGDGNGRTGRLLEFYLLLRAGTPDIASHILSNHYNDTKTEYYRQLERAGKTGDLSEFIEYALQGYKDGLLNTLFIIQQNLFTISWRSLVYDSFSEIKYRDAAVFKRKRRVLLDFPIEKELSVEEIFFQTPQLSREYASLSERTLNREIEEFLEMGLLLKEGEKYKANIDLLRHQVPQKKEIDKILDGF